MKMSMGSTCFGVLSFLLSGITSVWAGGFETRCYQQLPLPGGYCIHTPTENTSTDIVYYFHGAGGSERTWESELHYTAQVRAEWERLGVRLPTVVSVSFGPSWLLAPKNLSPLSGLWEVFEWRVRPAIERRIGEITGRRIVWGESMGGFNAIQLALRTSRFAKVAALCAPMSEVSPFASTEIITAHVQKSSAWQYYQHAEKNPVLDNVLNVVKLARSFFPLAADWTQADPLQLARNGRRDFPAFYLAAGFYDEYALYEANVVFAQRLREQGAMVEWRPQWGGHCAIDIPSLAQFLAQ